MLFAGIMKEPEDVDTSRPMRVSEIKPLGSEARMSIVAGSLLSLVHVTVCPVSQALS